MSSLVELSQYVCSLKLKDIPEDVVSAARFCLLDSVGAALGAVSYEEIPEVVDEIMEWSGDCTKKAACVWGQKRRTSVFQAALLNGIMTHALELDDVHTSSKTHIGAVVVPAAWTLADGLGSTGRELLEAVIAGYEVMARIGAGFGVSSHRLKGWHATGTAGTFGAAAASAKLLKLNKEQIVSAFGMAGTQSSGLWAFLEEGAGCKKLHTGRAAVNGMVAAFLSKAGMTGPAAILDAEDGGLYRAMSDKPDLTLVSRELGEKYEILFVDKKPYPSCRSTHPAIDAALRIKKKTGINPLKIDSIKVDTYEVGFKQCGSANYPQNIVDAKFSIPYTVASAILDGAVTLEQFLPEKILEGTREALAGKVTVNAAKSFTSRYPEQWGCLLKVKMADGTVLTEEVQDASGSVRSPLSREQELDKFLGLAASAVGKERARILMESILQIEGYERIPALF